MSTKWCGYSTIPCWSAPPVQTPGVTLQMPKPSRCPRECTAFAGPNVRSTCFCVAARANRDSLSRGLGLLGFDDVVGRSTGTNRVSLSLLCCETLQRAVDGREPNTLQRWETRLSSCTQRRQRNRIVGCRAEVTLTGW